MRFSWCIFVVAIGTMFPSMYYLTRALQELFLDHEFPTAEGDEMVFKDITTPSDFWSVSSNHRCVSKTSLSGHFPKAEVSLRCPL